MVGPNLWFSLTVLGVWLIYWEFLRPSLFLPAAGGLFLVIFGCYHLAVSPLTLAGVGLIAFAIASFLSELIVNTRFVAGIVGTVALAAGARELYIGPNRISPFLAVAGALMVGPVTMLLTSRARTARTNKRADL